MWQKFKKWANVDHLVDLAVDAFLLLFEVISSPVLIVMRILRWTIGHFFLEGIKNKIKKFIHWIKDKPWWLQMIVIREVVNAAPSGERILDNDCTGRHHRRGADVRASLPVRFVNSCVD